MTFPAHVNLPKINGNAHALKHETSCGLPQEIWDHILDFVGTSKHPGLRACALVHKAWTRRSQMHLFKVVLIRGNTVWRRLHVLLGDTAPHLRRLVRTLVLLGTAGADAGALDWTDLLPLVSSLSFACSPPDLAFMAHLPALCDLRITCAQRHGTGEDGWELAYLKAAVLHLPADARDGRLPHRLTSVRFSEETLRSVQALVLYWVASTATYRAQSLQSADLVIFPETNATLLQEFLDDNGGIVDLGLFITREPGLARINACILRLNTLAHPPGVRMVLDFLQASTLPALRVLEIKFQGRECLPLRDGNALEVYFNPFEVTAAGGAASGEDYAFPAALAEQVCEVTVILDCVQVLYQAPRFLQLFREVVRHKKFHLRHHEGLRQEDYTDPRLL